MGPASRRPGVGLTTLRSARARWISSALLLATSTVAGESFAQPGGTVRQPWGPAPWAAAYGMLTDRFGVTWVLDVLAA